MRPINLIPPEERRGENAPMRTGPLPYLLVGALVVILIGVTALVLTGNQIADSKEEVAKLEREDAVATARAERLAAYTQFRTLHEQRVATVTSLADSRFDWERVMRELSLILPHDAWLTSLDASASSEAAGSSAGGSGAGSSSLRASIAGPALEISGCASGQKSVARFVTSLKDIDGVTRVAIESSELSDQVEDAEASEAGSEGDSDGGDCRTRDFIAKFQIVVAFDAAPVPLSASVEVPVAPAPEETEGSPEATSTEGSEGG
jgi:Tfp pilus assembly protein PilN